MAEIADGNPAAAEKALNKGLEISLEIAPESSLVSQIKRLFGDLYLATGKFDLAKRYGNEALDVAEKIGERAEVAACYRIFAQIEQVKGNADKARDWYLKAIDLFGLIGSNYELAVTRYLAGASGLYVNGECHALLYLAREYFGLENVTPYIKKADSALRAARHPKPQKSRVAAAGNGCPTIIARSPVMKKLVERAENIAESCMPVLLTGDTGTGKGLFARYIHHFSDRTGEFVTVECTGIPESLLESELFGYEKGAFTGAVKTKQGRFELAHGGTLFLDEIGDIPESMQVKLLRALEDRKITRLGSVKEIHLDIRIIAATNRDLNQRMKENHFRPDLYYRLSKVLIDLPSLSERIDDIPSLIEHFLAKFGFEVNGNGPLLEHFGKQMALGCWKGNVREMEGRVEYLYDIADGDISRMLELLIREEPETEEARLLRLLQQTNWNRSQTARLLCVSEGTIRKRIKKYSLSPV